jgi:hypothetical protein
VQVFDASAFTTVRSSRSEFFAPFQVQLYQKSEADEDGVTLSGEELLVLADGDVLTELRPSFDQPSFFYQSISRRSSGVVILAPALDASMMSNWRTEGGHAGGRPRAQARHGY